MKKLVSFIFLLLLLPGCMNEKAYIYKPSDKLTAAPHKFPLKIAVSPLKDERGQENYNQFACIIVPLVPYCESSFDRPENTEGLAKKGLRPPEDFAKALIEEIKQNNIVDAIYISYKENEKDADLVISGTLRKAYINQKLTFYGLTAFGDLLWILGLPAGSMDTSVDITYQMRRVSDESVVWSHDVKGDIGRIIGLYYGKPEDPYDDLQEILRTGLHIGVEKLYVDLQSRPISYWKK